MWFFDWLYKASIYIVSPRDQRVLTSRKPPKGERRMPTLSAPTSSTTAWAICSCSQNRLATSAEQSEVADAYLVGKTLYCMCLNVYANNGVVSIFSKVTDEELDWD